MIKEGVLKLLIENGLFSGVLGAVGGAARIATGLAPNESIMAEVFRIVFIAMPLGWLAGGLSDEWGATEYMQNSVAVFVGLSSHNIAKAAMQIGILQLIEVVTGRNFRND